MDSRCSRWGSSPAGRSRARGHLAPHRTRPAPPSSICPSIPAPRFRGYPALSPDGTALVYPAGDAGSNRLYLRRLADPNPTPVPGAEGANTAFFSADGEWLGFLAEQSLKKVRLADGSEGVIAPYLDAVAGATWSEDGTILLARLPQGALFEVPAQGYA